MKTELNHHLDSILSQSSIEQKTLLSESAIVYQRYLDDIKDDIISESSFYGVSMPKYGMLSFYLRTMPVFAFDHPVICSKIGNTGFTDGTNLFISVNFINEINESAKLDKAASVDKLTNNGVTFLMLHEACHGLFNHKNRCLEFPHDLANIGQDYSINTRLQKDFVVNNNQTLNYMSPLPEGIRTGIGFKAGEIEKYISRSEEDICRELMEEAKNNPDKSSGQGQPGEGGQGMGSDHIVSPQDLADALKEAGLGHLIDLLGIPVDENGNVDSGKLAEIEARQEVNKQSAANSVEELKSKLKEKYPGGHIDSHASDLIKINHKPKITWKSALKSELVGENKRMTHTFDVPGMEYYIDPALMGVNTPLYIGAPVPSAQKSFSLVLLDTSGSMGEDELKDCVNEIMGIVTTNEDSAPEVMIMQIDTIIRGEPVIVNYRNVRKIISEGFNVLGRGGTSLTDGINMAMAHEAVQKRLKSKQPFDHLIYFTDLGDTPPKRANLHKDLPKKMIYMAAPGTYNDGFASAVSSYSKVVSMGGKLEIDLSQEKVNIKNKP